MGNLNSRGLGGGMRAVSMAALVACASLGHAAEATEDVGGVQFMWNNTFRYGLAARTRGQDAALTGNPNADDGDRNFNKGLISNRIDLFSELDAVLRPGTGARISAQGWYDTVYNTSNDNPGFMGGAVPNQRSVGPDQFTATTRRLQGRDVQVRDAFLFHKFDAAAGR